MQSFKSVLKSLRSFSPKVTLMQIWRYPGVQDEDTFQMVWQGTLYYLPIKKEEIEETEFYTCVEN